MKDVLKNTLKVLILPERQNLLVILVFSLLINVLDIISLAGLVVLVTHFSQPDLPMNYYVAYFFNSYDSSYLAGLMVLFFILKSIAAYLANKWQYHFVFNVAGRLSEKNLLAYLEGSYQNYVETDSSVFVRTISHEAVEFGLYVLSGFIQLISELMIVFITLVAIALFNIQLFALVFLVLLPPVVLVAFFTRRILKNARLHVKSSSETATQNLHEALNGFIDSNIFEKNGYFVSRYSQFQKRFNRYLAQLNSAQAIPTRMMEVFAVAGLAGLMIFSVYFNHSGSLFIPAIGAFMAGAYKIIPGLVRIQNITAQIKTFGFTTDHMVNLKNIPVNTPHNDNPRINSVIFSEVAFRYPQGLGIESVSFEIKSGDIIGISGPSGAGKTTIANLVLGFLEPQSGEIMINGVVADIANRKKFRNRISYVKQSPFILHDSILQNIVLGEDPIDQSRLDLAFSGSGLDSIMHLWENGFLTIVQESGKNFSGGQKQRIALARAFYKNASLFVFDEPFHGLDKASVTAAFNYMKSMADGGKMVMLITHEQDILSRCNKIITLKKSGHKNEGEII